VLVVEGGRDGVAPALAASDLGRSVVLTDEGAGWVASWRAKESHRRGP
jgi:hypothetical protein